MFAFGMPTWRPHRRARVAIVAVVDASAWIAGIMVATWLRFALDAGTYSTFRMLVMALISAVAVIALSLVLQARRGLHMVGSLDDVIDLGVVTAGVTLFVFALNAALPSLLVPRSVPLTAGLLALGASTLARLVARRQVEWAVRPDRASARRVVVFGAGVSGQQLIRSMLSDRASGHLPVALLDDEPTLRRRRVLGVPVLGGHRDVGAVAAAVGADTVVVAIRDLRGDVMREAPTRPDRTAPGSR